MGDFATAEAQGDLDLVAFLEKAKNRFHLHAVVVFVDAGAKLDFLDLDDLLLLARLSRLLLLGETKAAVIENFTDWRGRVWRNLD